MGIRIAVLASGRGSNLLAILQAITEGKIDGTVAVVLSDKAEAKALEHARTAGIPAYHVNPKAYEQKADYEAAMLHYIAEADCQLICLAGYMRILSPFFVGNAPCPVMNIHPALLPSFPGLHGQRQALEYGVKVAGCTVHFVDEGMDSGAIILQKTVPVLDNDTEDTLSARILEQEHKAYPEAIQLFAQGRLQVEGRRVQVKEEKTLKRALISVSDKTGVVEFARALTALDFEIVSTGGTARALKEAGVKVTGISDVTGFPEILEGRVKTLHPNVHGGILAKGTPEHMAVLAEHNITPIDLVVVNLYPFQATVAKTDVTLADAIENIDIGGPTMVRAAAKNHDRVGIVVNPARYDSVLAELKENGQLSLQTRQQLALEAFRHTAQYDTAISQYLGNVFSTDAE